MSITSDLPNERVRLDSASRDAMLELAEKNDRSLPAEIRRAVRFYVAAAKELGRAPDA